MPMYGVQFGMDGPSLDGTTWYNPKTNDVIRIKSNYFEDSVMKVQTSDGRNLTLDRLKDYVQWKGSGEPPKTPVKENKEELPPEVAAMLVDNNTNNDVANTMDDILPEDAALIQPKRVSINSSNSDYHPFSNHYSSLNTPQNTDNYNIIDRALNRASKPDWNLVMKWSNFPQKELDMLLSVMDIPVEEISDYYMNKIKQDFNDFIKDIKSQLSSYIKSKINPADTPKVPVKDHEAKPSKKITKKKNA